MATAQQDSEQDPLHPELTNHWVIQQHMEQFKRLEKAIDESSKKKFMELMYQSARQPQPPQQPPQPPQLPQVSKGDRKPI